MGHKCGGSNPLGSTVYIVSGVNKLGNCRPSLIRGFNESNSGLFAKYLTVSKHLACALQQDFCTTGAPTTGGLLVMRILILVLTCLGLIYFESTAHCQLGEQFPTTVSDFSHAPVIEGVHMHRGNVTRMVK